MCVSLDDLENFYILHVYEIPRNFIFNRITFLQCLSIIKKHYFLLIILVSFINISFFFLEIRAIGKWVILWLGKTRTASVCDGRKKLSSFSWRVNVQASQRDRNHTHTHTYSHTKLLVATHSSVTKASNCLPSTFYTFCTLTLEQ